MGKVEVTSFKDKKFRIKVSKTNWRISGKMKVNFKANKAKKNDRRKNLMLTKKRKVKHYTNFHLKKKQKQVQEKNVWKQWALRDKI